MEPSREIFWNIQYGEIIYILGALAVGVFFYAIYKQYRRWRLGGPANRFSQLGKRIRAFIVTGIVDGIVHRRFFRSAEDLGHGYNSIKDLRPREFYPGLAHFLIFVGCIVLILGAFMDFISHYFFHFMEGSFYLGYSVVVDSFGILAIIGVILAIIRRYGQKPARLDTGWDDMVALSLIFVIVITGFIIEGLRIAATELPTVPGWATWSPGGYALAASFARCQPGDSVHLAQGPVVVSRGPDFWSHRLCFSL